ncbi:protein kinase domain-containing protein [Botrimarina hoheduenensis]|uniref:Serine/threonine-protein kinase PknB n=1 Tax=Botrimarina hoheduenensis TaxID=2528000 RepID=A0A5C5VZ51_9BACT|nr:protein kinase [Botrimarina hoheduenensis]TWT43357.1 Serine/threonine-protein kinase PknB [Botrimarina hoheduenensis]
MPRCPACHKEYEAASAAGKRCPHCQAKLDGNATVDDLKGSTQEFEPVGADPIADASDTADFEAPLTESDTVDLDLSDSGTIELSSEPGQDASDSTDTVDLDPQATIELRDVHVDATQRDDQTIELQPGKGTVPIDSDMTIDLSALPPSAGADNLAATWAGAAQTARDMGQTIQLGSQSMIGRTVSGFRSTLPIKSRSLMEIKRPTGVSLSNVDDINAPDYELIDLLGQGGMGVVYAAKQSSIARTVAVKMLKPGSKGSGSGSQGDLDQRDKFISEAVITGELEHPNIVPIYDLGANAEGALFYSMKRVKGTPWDEVIQERSLIENLSILMRVADAVAFAHASGVVHRDLKPENVMLGDYGEVLVMDWGLARVTERFPSADKVYQSDGLGGTPAYMAPEMAKGPVNTIDARSDIYLLGAILFEAITGKPPHTGKDVMACLMAAATNEIRPVDSATAAKHADLLTIARTAMATRQEDRYESVKAMQMALQEHMAHAESVSLAASAEAALAEARRTGQYEQYSRALYGFEEALALWEGNQRAAETLVTARLDYARQARDNGDYDLAASLIESHTDDETARTLLAEIATARAERDARQQRLRNLKRLALALLLTVAGVVSVAYFEIRRQRNAAVEQRGIAEQQRSIAEEQRGIADERTAEAITQRAAAVEQREIAEKQREIAQAQERIAIEQREAAIAAREAEAVQRRTAEEAKRREAYEAYLARIGLAAAKIDENAFDEARSLLSACPAELRHWEWGRLVYLCGLAAQTFEQSAPVEAVAYAPDGLTVATGNQAGVVTLRATTHSVGPAPPAPRTIRLGTTLHALAYAPRGDRLAAACDDGVVRIIDPNQAKMLTELSGHEGGVLAVAYAPDGQTIATAGFDQTVRLWNALDGAALQTLQRHTWWVWAVRFSPDGSRLVSAGHDGRAIVWGKSAAGFSMLSEFAEHEGPVYDVDIDRNGLVATAGFDRTIRIWDPSDVRPIDIERRLASLPDQPSPHLVLRGHLGPVRAVRFSTDGKTLLSGSYDNTLRLWSQEAPGVWTSQRTLRGHGGRIYGVAMSPAGDVATSVGDDNRECRWEFGSPGETRVLKAIALRGHADALLSARYTPNGAGIVTASRDQTARLWDAATGQPVVTLDEGHAFLASNATLFDNGRGLASAAGDDTVRVWDVVAGAQRYAIPCTGREAALAISDRAGWLATGSDDNAVRVWSLADGAPLGTLTGHEAPVTALAADPAGKRIASGDQRGSLQVWHLKNDEWKIEHTLLGHSAGITGLAFTPDGTRLVSASGDHTCGQWDLNRGEEIKSLVLKHPDWVSSLSISRDGEQALTACADGVVRLWRLAEATTVATVRPEADVNAVDLAPSGEAWLTAATAGRLYRWTPQSADSELQEVLADRVAPGSVWIAKAGPTPGTLIGVGGNDIQLWQVDPAERLMRFSPHGAVADAAVSAEGTTLATASWDGSIKLWDAATGQSRHRIERAGAGYLNRVLFINSQEFMNEPEALLTAGDDGVARILSLKDRSAETIELRGHTGPIYDATADATGQHVATASADGTVRLWSTARRAVEQTLRGDAPMLAVAFSPAGDLVVSGSEDSTATIWNASTGAALHVLGAHTAGVTSVAFSPDGARILTASRDGSAKVWDARSGAEVLTLSGHQDELTRVSFSPDGSAALTSGRDGAAIIWPAAAWDASGSQR